jgi:sRNA-binding regulator protein Hfq
MFIQPCSKGTVAVNSEKVEEIRRLNDKDIIEIGRYVFKFLDTQFRQQIKVFMMNGKTSKGMLEYWDLSQSIFFMIQTDKEKEKFCTVRFDEVAYVHFYRDQSEREQSYVSSLFRRRKAAREACIKVILKNGKKLSGFIRNKDGPGPGEGPGLFLIPNEEKSKIQYTYIPRNGIKRIIE